jgi:histidine phosphotransfer protein HptB
LTTIDEATFRELQQSMGGDFVRELVATFAEEAPQIVAELRSALQEQSAERFRRAAHSLKSNGSTFGATEVAARSRDLELGGLPADASAVDALQHALASALADLQELCRD